MTETNTTNSIDSLLKTATGDAADSLLEIANNAASKDEKKAAKRALYLLSQKGITPSLLQQYTPPVAQKSALQANVRFLMSNIDGGGNQMLWFVLPDPDGGKPLLLSTLASDEQGVKDFMAAKMTRSELEEKIELYEDEADGLFADAEPDFGRWLVAQAQTVNREKLKPYPAGFLEFLPRIGEPEQQYDSPPLEGLPSAEEIDADETFPREAAALLAKPVFDGWFLGMDVILPELLTWMKTLAEKNDDGPDETKFKRDAMIQRVTETVVTPGTRDRYVSRLLLSAIVCWKNEDETTAKQCLYHAHKLQTNSVASDFAIALVQRTLDAAREMLLGSMRERDSE